MLLTIHNLPSGTRYSDVKGLLQEKCGLTELILDNLVSEGKTKKVTVGLADEGDAAILVRKVNGLYINGQQLYVEDKRKKKESDQPYRSSASILQEVQYQEAALNQPHVMDSTMMANIQNPMMMNYNMVGMYMPMPSIDQNIPYMAYGVPQAMPSTEFLPAAPVPNERGFAGFQGEGNAQGRAREGPQGRNRDRNRRPSPERPTPAFNRASRWNEKPTSSDFSMRREKSPPRPTWVPPEMNQGPRAPFRKPERPGPRDSKQYQTRQPEPEFRRTDAQWEDRPSGWDAEPDPRMRSEPEQEWASSGPNRNFDPARNRPWDEPNRPIEEPNRQWVEPNRPFEEPNQQWAGYSHTPNVDFPRPDRFESNVQRFDEDYPPNHYRNEPDFQGREPEFRGNAQDFQGHEPEFQGHEPEFRGHELDLRGPKPNFHGPERPERSSRPRQPDGAWNKGDSRDRTFAPNNWSKDRGERREDRRPIQPGRSDKPHPISSSSTSQRGNERHDDRHPNPKRPHSDRDRAPNNWKQIANDYPASKRPKGNFDKRNNFQEPRQQPPFKENVNVRPQLFNQGVVNRPTETDSAPPVKHYTMKSLINKDQTSRGQATAIIAKEVMPALSMADPENRFILKELKKCIKGRIDVMLGEELSRHYEDVVRRYRLAHPKKKDRAFYKAIRDNCLRQQEMDEKKDPNEELNPKALKEEIEVKTETVAKKEIVDNEVSKDPEPSASTQSEEDNKELNQHQIKSQNRPLTDKQIISEQKKQRKLEFSKEDLFKLDPIMDQVLDEELNKLTEILASECNNPVDEVDTTICNRITNQSADEFKKVLRLHLTKRILNVTTGLPIRIFSEGKLPKRTALKEYLLSYRLERLVLKKNKKGTMFVANLSKYSDYDRLCQIEHDIVDGTPVTFRSMNLLGPPMRMSKSHIQQRRRELIKKQVDSVPSMGDVMGDGDYTEDVDYNEHADYGGDADYTEDVDIDDFREEDLEDF